MPNTVDVNSKCQVLLRSNRFLDTYDDGDVRALDEASSVLDFAVLRHRFAFVRCRTLAELNACQERESRARGELSLMTFQPILPLLVLPSDMLRCPSESPTHPFSMARRLSPTSCSQSLLGTVGLDDDGNTDCSTDNEDDSMEESKSEHDTDEEKQESQDSSNGFTPKRSQSGNGLR